MDASAAPLIWASRLRVCRASALSSLSSGPLRITARSADDPVTISVAVSIIGWVKLNVAPGIAPVSRAESSSTSPAFVRPGRQPL
jgi:hypothetical protein